MVDALYGKKIGCTQIFRENGDAVYVTAIEAEPCVVVQVKNKESHGYNSLQVGVGQVKDKKVKKPARGIFAKNKVDITLKGTESLPDADFARREVTIMFTDQESVHLMDSESYEQYEIAAADVAEEMKWVAEGMEGLLALIFRLTVAGTWIPTHWSL